MEAKFTNRLEMSSKPTGDQVHNLTEEKLTTLLDIKFIKRLEAAFRSRQYTKVTNRLQTAFKNRLETKFTNILRKVN
jgi:hypothetical protein